MRRYQQFVAAIAVIAVLASPAAALVMSCGRCLPPATTAQHESMPCCPESTTTSNSTDASIIGSPAVMGCCSVTAAPVNERYTAVAPVAVGPVEPTTTIVIAGARPVSERVETRAHASPPLAVLCSFLI